MQGARGGGQDEGVGVMEASPIMALAYEQPERFLELVSYLPHIIQDIFYQYYLLGRTFEQIREVLLPNHKTVNTVHELNQAGIRGLCAIIKFGKKPTEKQLRGKSELAAAYRAMVRMSSGLRITVEESSEVECDDTLGKFSVLAEEDLSQIFPPSWSVLGCRGGGVARR